MICFVKVLCGFMKKELSNNSNNLGALIRTKNKKN